MNNYLSYFTPSEMAPKTLEDIFVSRQKLAKRLVDDVRDSVLTPGKHQNLLIGPRGMGKSHIVALVYHRVKELEELEGKVAIAWLAEEEWSVASLVDLYFVILDALEREYKGLTKQIDALYRMPEDDRLVAAADAIRAFVGERTLFLLVENLEEIFNGLSSDELWSLRSFLSQSSFSTILATTPSLFEGISKQKEAFFGFFQQTHLYELTVDEAVELLEKLAIYQEDTDLANFLKTPTGQDRVQAVHDLAGGHPRIYLLFAHLLNQKNLEELVTPFLEFLDELTPYYQDRMNRISPQQRKIVTFLSDRRGAAPIKEMVTRMNGVTSQTVSKQLNTLEESGYVRKTVVGRESHYELREPLLRMVLEKKRGRGEPIRLVVDFLRRWYSRDERRERLAFASAKAALTRRYLEASLDLGRALQDTPDAARAERLLPDLQDAYQSGDYTRAVDLSAEIIERKGFQSSVSDLSQHATCLAESGKFLEALASYDKALELEPSDAAAWLSRGITLANLARYEDALTSYNKALELEPSDATTWFNRGITLGNLARHEDALTSYDKALELEPSDAAAWLNRGGVLDDLQRYEDALVCYDKALELEPLYVKVWFNRGIALDSLQRHEDALVCYDKALELEPLYAKAWFNRGIALDDLQRYEDALASYDRALELEPSNAPFWFNRGIALDTLQRYEDALASYDRALELEPLYTKAWLNRGNILAKLQRYEDALVSYDKALELEPHYFAAWFNRGITLDDLQRYEDALVSYDKALGLEPLHSRAWLNRGVTLANSQRHEDALDSYDKAQELEPYYFTVWFNRGITLDLLQRHEDALASYDRALELEPSDASAWFNRGNILANLYRYEDALASYDKSLKIKPLHVKAWLNRGNTLAKLQRYEDALASYDEALKLESKIASAWFNRAATLGHLKQHELALASYDKALELEPKDASVWIAQGISQYALQRHEEALASFQHAVFLDPTQSSAWFNQGEVLLIQARWNEFLYTLEKGFAVADQANYYRGDTKQYCGTMILQHRADEANFIATLTNLYAEHGAAAQLGQGLTDSIPALMNVDVTQERAEAWLAAWEAAAVEKKDLTVPLRLLRAAVAWKPKRDVRALLALAIEERRILETLLPKDAA